MRIHTDHLTGNDLHDALRTTGLAAEGCFIAGTTPHGSRSRHHAYEFRMFATAGKDRFGKTRRPAMNAPYGSDRCDPSKAATYDEWGLFIEELFRRDPDAIVGPYKGLSDLYRAWTEPWSDPQVPATA